MTTLPTPRTRLLPAALVGALAGLAALSAPGAAHEPDAEPKQAVTDVVIELLTGQVHGNHPAVTLTRPPRDADGDGYFEAGVKVDLTQYAGLEVVAEYGDVVPRGITLNLGDSRSNNGFRGDSCSQSNDAEAHAADTSLLVWGNDQAPADQAELGRFEQVVSAGCVLRLLARDGLFHFASTAGQGSQQQLRSPFLYALAGQPDTEGPVNHDLFLGLNCAVNGARRGSGLARVTIRPLQ